MCNVEIQNDGGLVFVEAPIYIWEPQPDITPYELALCMPILVTRCSAGVKDLPAEARRHFKRE